MAKLQGEFNGFKEVFTVLDLETTSLDQAEGQIIEIAAIKTDLEREYGRLEMRVKLNDEGATVSDFTTELTGITTEDLQGGMPEPAAVLFLTLFAMGSTVVAQYAPFDLSYLEARGFVPEFFIDTRTLTRVIDPNIKSASLMPTYERLFGHKFENAHRAMADVEATVEVLREQFNRAEAQGIKRADIQNLVLDTKDRPLRYVPKFAKVKSIETKSQGGNQ